MHELSTCSQMITKWHTSAARSTPHFCEVDMLVLDLCYHWNPWSCSHSASVPQIDIWDEFLIVVSHLYGIFHTFMASLTMMMLVLTFKVMVYVYFSSTKAILPYIIIAFRLIIPKLLLEFAVVAIVCSEEVIWNSQFPCNQLAMTVIKFTK